MPVQQQNDSFVGTLGKGRIAAANTQHRDAPVDTGTQRLPPGIRDGVAKLTRLYCKKQDRENGVCPKGFVYFRAEAEVKSPKEHGGVRCEGRPTSLIIPLCDTPAKGEKSEVTYEAHWFDFQNFFKWFAIQPPPAGTSDEAVQAYYFSAMNALLDPANPVHVTFSTRGWTPPKTKDRPNPTEMVFEEWHGAASADQVRRADAGYDPAGGIAAGPPVPLAAPARNGPQSPALQPATQIRTVADAEADLADEVQSLVEMAAGDTPEGQEASARLEALAWQAGWSKEQTTGAPNWEAVGDMALNPPGAEPPTTAVNGTVPSPEPRVVPGSRWLFARRARDGSKLKVRGVDVAAAEVEVVSVNAAARTCTLRTGDGREVADIRSKKPVDVKWEWLEAPPY